MFSGYDVQYLWFKSLCWWGHYWLATLHWHWKHIVRPTVTFEWEETGIRASPPLCPTLLLAFLLINGEMPFKCLCCSQFGMHFLLTNTKQEKELLLFCEKRRVVSSAPSQKAHSRLLMRSDALFLLCFHLLWCFYKLFKLIPNWRRKKNLPDPISGATVTGNPHSCWL